MTKVCFWVMLTMDDQHFPCYSVQFLYFFLMSVNSKVQESQQFDQ